MNYKAHTKVWKGFPEVSIRNVIIASILYKMLSTSDKIPCNTNNPCRNDGTCYGTMLEYQCACPDGHTGSNCESK